MIAFDTARAVASRYFMYPHSGYHINYIQMHKNRNSPGLDVIARGTTNVLRAQMENQSAAVSPTEQRARRATTAIVLSHIAMLSYAAFVAGSFSFGALAAPHISPVALTAARFLLAALLMGTALVALSRQIPKLPQAPWRFVILGTLMGVFFVLMFVALKITNPVSTSAVFTLIPLMSAYFGYLFLRQTTRPVVLASLGIAAIGALWVIFRGDLARALAFDVGRGETLFFIGCACQAAYGPLVRKFNRGETTHQSTFWTLVAATVCVGLYAAPDIAATPWSDLPAVVWYCLLYLAIFSTALTFFLLQYASMHLRAAKVFAYGYLIPTFVIIIEGVLGHGWASPYVLAGALVTVCGLVLLLVFPDQS